jgi:hypothetical protein
MDAEQHGGPLLPHTDRRQGESEGPERFKLKQFEEANTVSGEDDASLGDPVPPGKGAGL